MSTTEDEETPDTDTLLKRIGQRLSGDEDEDAQTANNDEAGQKDAPEGDHEEAEQKQPDENPVDDLIVALAEELNADPDELKAVIQRAMDGDDEDEEEDEEDVEQDTEGDDDAGASGEVTIDFGEKLAEHDVVTEEELGEKLAEFQDEVVDELGQKLSETAEEAIEEVGQKMQSGSTPSPAGGTFQDEQDFESALSEVADKEGW